MQLQGQNNQAYFPRVLGFRVPRTRGSISVVGMITHLDQRQRKLTLQVDSITKHTVQVTIPNTEPAELRELKFIEVRGYSTQQGNIEMKDYTNFMDNFDLKTYNEVIKLSSESAFKSIFGY